jgi:glutamyl-tRNA reductase
LPDSWASWSTCLRQLAFGHSGLSAPRGQVEIFTGADAYGFCLEVVCGLKSPLAGETEVMGQFREFLSSLEGSSSLKRILENILIDAKHIRHKHLTNLGSQSYGSLSRKHLQNIKIVHILGSGKLTREMLPWFSDKTRVYVHCRQPEKQQDLETKFANVSVSSLDAFDPSRTSAVVIAAPVTATEFSSWLKNANVAKILDLRGESKTDPIQNEKVPVVSLKDFYRSLEDHQVQIKERVEAARQDIQRLTHERANLAELRPFGWDDLCA